MAQTLPDLIPNRVVVERKLTGARYQIQSLEALPLSIETDVAAVESYVSGAIDQLLQAVSAALYGFNQKLPEPLPPQRVNRRNLRDEFQAVRAQSTVLRTIEQMSHSGDGWLGALEEQRAGAAVAPLVQQNGGVFAVIRDPLNPENGTEPDPPVEYLKGALNRVADLLTRIGEEAPDDVTRYREAKRQQVRRLI